IKNYQQLPNVIGEGGFGTVYQGCVGESQVAVKMLSSYLIDSMIQGISSSGMLLTSVHHKNSTSLFGYCKEGTHMGLTYEHIAKWKLR
ncbi:Non-specific serine/threonine protein kinase, partial [Bertholletia excelsa]